MVTAPPVMVGGSLTSVTVTTVRKFSLSAELLASVMVTNISMVAGSSQRSESASKSSAALLATVSAPVVELMAKALLVLPLAMA